MCDCCGCDESFQEICIQKQGEVPSSAHKHTHEDKEPQERQRTIQVEQNILAKNNTVAADNRRYFTDNSIFALNLVSSPGSGKTTLLEKSINRLEGTPLAVIEGDQQTTRDAERIAATGAEVVQVNTGTGCHLDAGMVRRAAQKLALQKHSVLFIENVGNLVCPALFDLGEAHKVVIISVTEGEDKPQKYPHMFAAAEICIINKIDLLPYVNFDVSKCRQYAQQVNPRLIFFELSATTGEGMAPWLNWLQQNPNIR
ncbi:MAG: hydrogenase nickel incorporation protein HypB [Desulfobulbaceae bacterium]|nr:hydrogenase nickel incorporation protein HypB [Desulfobulbaceae bacterium]